MYLHMWTIEFNRPYIIHTGVGDTTRHWFSDVAENNKAYEEVFFRFNRYYQKQDAYSKTCLHLLKAFDLSKFKTVVDLGGERVTNQFLSSRGPTPSLDDRCYFVLNY